MENAIRTLLEKTSPRWRTRVIQQNPQYLEWFENTYPRVSLNIQIHSFLTGQSPYCLVCSSPVQSVGKKTCSIRCRTQADNAQDRLLRARQTMQQRYGVNNPAQLPIFKDKRKQTMLEKYNGLVSEATRQAASSRSADLNRKGRKTLKEKYGVTNPGQLVDHRDRCRTTSLQRYGVDHYRKSAAYQEKVRQQQQSKWDYFSPSSITVTQVSKATDKLDLFLNPNALVEFRCSECNGQFSLPSETFKWRIQNCGTPCSSCANLTKGSAAEAELRQFVEQHSPGVVANAKILDGLEVDIFLPSHGLGIEYHGLFWHNDCRVDKNYHRKKLEIAESKNIRLIQIFEDEWIHRPSIVKSRILSLLGKTDRRLSARKCQLREVNSQQAKRFFEDNHVQGHTNATVTHGLYLDDELVAAMSWAKLSSSKGYAHREGHWELLRFCSLVSSTVAGAASRLFVHFLKTYDPLEVISFADLRWGSGSVYQTMGFSFAGNTRIGYWYIDLKNTKRRHRYSLRKNKDDDPNLTEYQNRQKQGYLRIWDCGHARWKWTKNKRSI